MSDRPQAYKEALRKIDEIVSGDYGFEADCYIGLDKPRNKIPKYADEWAKMIVDIYKITHPLLHKCCQKEQNS